MTDDRFIILLLKEFSGEISTGEKEEFRDLLKNEIYLKRYNFYSLYWSRHRSDSIDNEALFQKIKLRIGGQESESALEGHLKRRSVLRYAAAVLLVGVCFFFFYKTRGPSPLIENNQWTERSTARGNKVSFRLPDGTLISLNSESKIRYPKVFTGNSREIYLKGEAFFDVKKDASHPFIIHAGKMNVKVLGTAFNVKAYPDDASSEITLIRGLVEVTLKDRPADKITLNPTEKLIVNYSDETANDIIDERNGEIKKSTALTQITNMQKQNQDTIETSWMKNRLILKDQDFSEACSIMERWYDVDIHINNNQLKDLRFSSIFENETLEEALSALQHTEAFRYKIEGKSVYIY